MRTWSLALNLVRGLTSLKPIFEPLAEIRQDMVTQGQLDEKLEEVNTALELELLAEALQSLKLHYRNDVVLEVFDSSCTASTNLGPSKHFATWTRGHG